MSHFQIDIHTKPGFNTTQASPDLLKKLKELYYNLFITKNSRCGRISQWRDGELVDITEEHNQQCIQEAQISYDTLCHQLKAHCTHRVV